MTPDHSQTTDLLDQTIDSLSNGLYTPSVEDSASLLQQWIQVLNQGENTRDIAGQLTRLNEALSADTPDADAIKGLLHEIAEQVSQFGMDTGAEGDVPSRMESLATALRNAGNQLSTAE